MPRTARASVGDYCYHVINRGNARAEVFHADGDYQAFLDRMEAVLAELVRVLNPRRYAVLIVRDAYQDGQYLFTGADLAARAARVGLRPKGDLIWYQAGTRLRPYGYPTGFVPNISHQHLLVLRKG